MRPNLKVIGLLFFKIVPKTSLLPVITIFFFDYESKIVEMELPVIT